VLLSDIPCDDGDACTQTDTCENGQCVGSNPVTCSVCNQCQSPGTCDSYSGKCSDPEDLTGNPCDDGDACTQTDTCQYGECAGFNPVKCPEPAAQCQVGGTCDPYTGQCSSIVLLSDIPCDDGDACTQTDTCENGQCVGSNPVTCPPGNQCQRAGTCDPYTGDCSSGDFLDNIPCDDGNACTQTDTCQYGECVGEDNKCCRTKATCGLCVKDCGNAAPLVLDFFGLEGDRHDVSGAVGGGWACPGTEVCCSPKDQSHVKWDRNLNVCVVLNSTPQ
jgi:hypothetical protein